jgi:integrase/recombinase XerD
MYIWERKKRALTPPSSYGCPFNKKLYGKFRGISAHPSQPVFLNKNGKKLNPRSLHKIFKEILQKAGLSRIKTTI